MFAFDDGQNKRRLESPQTQMFCPAEQAITAIERQRAAAEFVGDAAGVAAHDGRVD